jgi:hypothetical protein
MRLPFDDYAMVKAVVADSQVLHADLEIVALAREIEQRGVLFGKIDSQMVTHDGIAASDGRPGGVLRHTGDVDYVWSQSNPSLIVISAIDRVRGCRVRSDDDDGIVVEALSNGLPEGDSEWSDLMPNRVGSEMFGEEKREKHHSLF